LHLHTRASAWLEQKGLISEAIQHLITAGEIEQAADLIERYGPARLAESDPGVLLMADNLPQEMILARPKIGLYQAWLLIVQARIAKAHPLLIDLRQKIAGAELVSGQRWMQTYIATALAFLAPAASMAKLGPLPDYELLEEIPAEEQLLRNAADYLYGMALSRRGDLERAVGVSLKSIQREQVPYGGASIPTLVPFLSRTYLMQGRLQDAVSLCREYLDPIKEQKIRFIYSTGSMKIDLGEALYEWNRLEEAEQQIRDGLHDNIPWRNIMTDGFGLATLARVLNAKGDYAGAMQAADKFESRLLEHAQPREFDEDLRTLRVRLQLAMGEQQEAHRWAEQVVLREDFNLHPEFYRLVLARIWLTQGRYADVEKLLTGTTPPRASGSQVSRQVESNLLLAASAAGQGRLEEAGKLVDACLAQAEPEGYVRVFLDAEETGRGLLAAYLRTAEAGHKLYAQQILDAFSSTSQGSPLSAQQGGLIEPLTEREMEILHLMALGMTNKEIARELIIAPGTVKAHTSSIYSKLEAANRTEAVGRARQLAILS
ncbi:MAG: LuxR C-terminal-related transcriptional regulator, partial [Anaerolineales bacterium]